MLGRLERRPPRHDDPSEREAFLAELAARAGLARQGERLTRIWASPRTTAPSEPARAVAVSVAHAEGKRPSLPERFPRKCSRAIENTRAGEA
jgi:hypothetical protein